MELLYSERETSAAFEKNLYYHKVENIGNLEEANEYMGTNGSTLLKGGVSYDDFQPKEITNPLYVKHPDMYDYKTGEFVPFDTYFSDEYQNPKAELTSSQQMDNWIRSQLQRSKDRMQEYEEKLFGNPNAEDYTVSAEIEKYINSDSTPFDEKALENGYSNKESGSNKIYTREDIVGMSSEEFEQNKKAIDYQKKTIGVPTKEEAQKAVSSGGMVYVNSYTRGDGTQVNSYYRARPSR